MVFLKLRRLPHFSSKRERRIDSSTLPSFLKQQHGFFFFNSMNPLALRLLKFSILNLSLKQPTRGSIIKWIPLASSPGAFKKCQTFGVGHEINKNKKQDCSQPGGGPASIWESPGVHLPRDGCSWEGVGSSRWLLCAELASEKAPHSPKLIFSRCSTSAIHLSRLIYSEITTTMY